MDKLSDFFKHFTDRFRNPLILSFLISWAVFNWRAIIAVLFFKREDLAAEGAGSLNQYISSVVTTWSGVGNPLISAVLFTAGYPIITALLYVFYGKIQAIGRDRHLKWNKHSSIPMQQFIELQEKSDSYIDKLQKLITEKSSFESEKKEHFLKLAEKDAEIKRLEDDQNLRDVSVMRGKWDVHMSSNGSVVHQHWTIDGNSVSRTMAGERRSELIHLQIANFAKTGDKIFIYFGRGAIFDRDVEFHVLIQVNGLRRLAGKNQHGAEVQYTFISDLQN